MYCPETIKRLNAKSNLESYEDINRALLTIKTRLCQVIEFEHELEAAGRLKVEQPQRTVQLSLVEQFYRAQRTQALEIEQPVMRLIEARKACAVLLEEQNKQKGFCEARLVTALRTGNLAFKRDAEFASKNLSREYQKLTCLAQAIEETLSEYSAARSKSF